MTTNWPQTRCSKVSKWRNGVLRVMEIAFWHQEITKLGVPQKPPRKQKKNLFKIKISLSFALLICFRVHWVFQKIERLFRESNNFRHFVKNWKCNNSPRLVQATIWFARRVNVKLDTRSEKLDQPETTCWSQMKTNPLNLPFSFRFSKLNFTAHIFWEL